MELLYVWIENYKNIYRQGFNFSPLYDFEFTLTEGTPLTGELKDRKTNEERSRLEKVYDNWVVYNK